MKQSIPNFQETALDNDDFAISFMLNRLETGQDVDNQEFSAFIKKCQDLIRSLHNMVGHSLMPGDQIPKQAF